MPSRRPPHPAVASSKTMLAPLPPSSSCTRFRFPAEACTILRPVTVEPGERDLVDALVLGQILPCGVPVARHDIHHARRKTHVRHQLGDAQRAQRRQLGRLQNDRVAGRQRRTHLPAGEQQRKIPRHDRAHHAQRLARDVIQKARLPPARSCPAPCPQCRRSSGTPPPCAARRGSFVSRIGCPVSRLSSSAQIIRRRPRSRRPACSSNRPRSAAAMRFHAGNALRAAATARSISTAVASATFAIRLFVVRIVNGNEPALGRRDKLASYKEARLDRLHVRRNKLGGGCGGQFVQTISCLQRSHIDHTVSTVACVIADAARRLCASQARP